MNKTIKIIAGTIVGLLAIFGAYKLLPTSVARYGDISHISGGLQVMLSNVGDTFTVGTTATGFSISGSAGSVYTGGGITFGGGVYSTSTASTSAAVTLSALAFPYNLISFTTGTSTTNVITLPASSTFPTTWLANAGDSDDIYIYAASTTGGVLQFANGTGFTLSSPIGIASTTAASSTIPAGSVAVLKVLRLPNTNLQAVFIPTK